MRKIRVAIIGAGPAGISCAIQLKRYKIDFLLFEKNESGGLLRNANWVENYPGFPEGTTGAKLVDIFIRQMVFNHIRPVKEEVKFVEHKNNDFIIKTDKNRYHAWILVIASGTKPKELPIFIPERCRLRIFYEIVDLKNLRNKKIAIIGSGDGAFDYALNLGKKNKVFILNRKNRVKCLPLLFERCKENENIKYYPLFDVCKIDYKDKNLLVWSKSGEKMSFDYLIIAIGREPNLDFLSDDIRKKQKSLEKDKILYIIGDAKNGIYRQTAIAVGDGIKAGMEIGVRYYEGNW
ncbi:MAG: NAD(P)/FAD-dependent oxidoreductase [bacterium]